MSKQVEKMDNIEQIRTTEQQSIVIVKPKYFIGSSGLVWSSYLMDLRYREPYLHLLPNGESWQGKLFYSLCFRVLALLRSLLNQMIWEDICLVTDREDCAFHKYELNKFSFFSQKFLEITESVCCVILKLFTRYVHSHRCVFYAAHGNVQLVCHLFKRC